VRCTSLVYLKMRRTLHILAGHMWFTSTSITEVGIVAVIPLPACGCSAEIGEPRRCFETSGRECRGKKKGGGMSLELCNCGHYGARLAVICVSCSSFSW
jgi:hypothetical protein